MSVPSAEDHFSGADSHNIIVRITDSLHFRAFTGKGDGPLDVEGRGEERKVMSRGRGIVRCQRRQNSND